MKSLHALEKTGIRALHDAEAALLKHWGRHSNHARKKKEPGQILTDADVAANNAIIKILRKETPDFDILSEEGAPMQNSAYRWIVDPLDGTSNFATGIPIWGISIALEIDGDIVLGLIGLPLFKTRYITQKNGGAWKWEYQKKRKRLHVSKTKTFKDAKGGICFSSDPKHASFASGLYQKIADQTALTRHFGASVYDATLMAEGKFDYGILLGVKPWDCAAGALLVREAGGAALNLQKEDWSLPDSQIVFCAPGIRRALFSKLNA